MSPAASFGLGIQFANSYFVIRGAHQAISIIENTCWEGLERFFKENELFVDFKMTYNYIGTSSYTTEVLYRRAPCGTLSLLQ
jgi:hypothetical protein